MSHDPQHHDPEKSPRTEPAVPEKQIYRWKDDGGALPPVPEQDPGPDRD